MRHILILWIAFGTTFALASGAPKLSLDEQERFLKTAEIVAVKSIGSGLTKPVRATMTDGRITHDAEIQGVDVYVPVWKGKDGSIEKNFRDSYTFNIAAYRVAKLLGVNMVPPSVERDYLGKPAAFTWWVEDVQMTEEERRLKKVPAPADQVWANQWHIIRVFDQLIHNTDRNQGNLLIDKHWRLWMIDHTRAFRTARTLLKPDALVRCDVRLLDAMRKLDQPMLQREIGPWVRTEEITGLLARRDLIVGFFKKEVADKGESAVLTGIPMKTPSISIP